MTSIEQYAFWECPIETATIPAFAAIHINQSSSDIYNSKLKTVIITSGDSIGDDEFDYAFTGCHALTSVEIPNSVTSIGSAFNGCRSLACIEIPKSVTSIGDDAFRDCSSLMSIEIPSGVTSIGERVFYGCRSLASIEIPKSVTSIGDSAFVDCSSLTSIEIPKSVTSIGNYAFSGCSSLTIYCEVADKPSNWRSSWNYYSCPVVWDCKNINKDDAGYAYAVIDGIRYSLKDGVAMVIRQPKNVNGAIIIPSSVTHKNETYSVTSIEGRAFYGCSSLTSITISNSVTYIGWYAFDGCPIETATLPIFAIGYIEISNLKTVVITSGDSIGNYAFSGCRSLACIEIPKSVTRIWDSAFEDCSSLTSIVIPNSVTYIGRNAFENCSSLTIYCEAESEPSGWSSSWNSSNCPVVWGYNGNE